MAFVDVEYGVGGGTINPTFPTNNLFKINKRSQYTFNNYDNTKDYIIVSGLDSQYFPGYTGAFLVHQGIVSTIVDNEYFELWTEVEISGNTLIIKNNNSDFDSIATSIIQLN